MLFAPLGHLVNIIGGLGIREMENSASDSEYSASGGRSDAAAATSAYITDADDNFAEDVNSEDGLAAKLCFR